MMEKKTLTGKLELKFANSDDAADKSFVGYGAYFNNSDAYGDIIAPGAFTKTISEFVSSNSMPALLWNHDSLAMPIGIWNTLSEDANGLKAEGQFLDTTSGNDAYTLVKAGAVNGLSIGYIVTGFEISKSNGTTTRLISEVKLFEISVVTFPANDLARVESVKSFDDEDDCDCDPDNDDCDCDDELFNSLTAKGFDPEATRSFLKSAKSKTKASDDMVVDNEADDEEVAEAKYNQDAVSAVQTLILKLKQELHGR